MIKVIKQKPDYYKMICENCDCWYSYELADLKKNYYEQKVVQCPCCQTEQLHSKREREE